MKITKTTTVAFALVTALFVASFGALAAASPSAPSAPVPSRSVRPAQDHAAVAQDRSAEPTMTAPKVSPARKAVTPYRAAQRPTQPTVKRTAWRCWQTPLDTTYNGTVTRCEVVEI